MRILMQIWYIVYFYCDIMITNKIIDYTYIIIWNTCLLLNNKMNLNTYISIISKTKLKKKT